METPSCRMFPKCQAGVRGCALVNSGPLHVCCGAAWSRPTLLKGKPGLCVGVLPAQVTQWSTYLWARPHGADFGLCLPYYTLLAVQGKPQQRVTFPPSPTNPRLKRKHSDGWEPCFLTL